MEWWGCWLVFCGRVHLYFRKCFDTLMDVLPPLILAQLVLLAGKLNTLAAVVTVFYLVAYAAVDLSCLSLEWASAPNFR